MPSVFNSNGDDSDGFDTRSDNKGPEPEAVAIGHICGKYYAFIGLERIGGIMVYDVTDPANATFVTYVNNRDFVASTGDIGVEEVIFIPAAESPNGNDLVVASNEVSGTVTVFEVTLEESCTIPDIATASVNFCNPPFVAIDFAPVDGAVGYLVEATIPTLGRTITKRIPTPPLVARFRVPARAFGETIDVRLAVIFANKTVGDFSKTATFTIGCQDDDQNTLENRTDEIVEMDWTVNAMSVYPNPAQTRLEVIVEAVDAEAVLKVFDFTGRLVLQQSATAFNTIAVEKLTAGVYTVVVESQTMRLVERFTKL